LQNKQNKAEEARALPTSTLIVFADKGVLNHNFIKIILEQQRRYEVVEILRESSDKGHGCKFVIELVQSEPGGT
jgi:hypothetical protein